ncbi:hypothetical protein DRQ29_03675 [bacterium]|nr:MAG: hypothetical protein DRQ29_03675 [bacterium]
MHKILVIIGAIVIIASAQDIQIQYFQEPDDIKNAYYNNEITEEQYYELLQLYEEKVEVNTGNLRRLLAIPGVERPEIEAVEKARLDRGPFRDENDVRRAFRGDFNLIEPIITVMPPARKIVSGYFKVYNSRKYESPSSSTDPSYSSKIYLRSGKWSADIRHRQKGTNMAQLSYRSVQYRSRKLQLIIGNYYSKDLGYGLLVGRYISLSSYKKDNDGLGYWLSPYYGDMNGTYLNWKIGRHWSVQSAISTNYYYKDSYQDLISAAVSYYKSRLGRLGMVLYRGSLVDFTDSSTADIRQMGASIYGEFRKGGWKFRNETGVIQNGAWGTNLYIYSPRTDGVNYLWKFWAYHPQFRPLYSDGQCDKGYQSYYPDDFSFYVKAYQAGELGCYASAKFPLSSKIESRIKASYFQVTNYDDNGAEGYIGLKYKMGRKGYIDLYIDRRFDGWGATGTTKDKINLSARWNINRKFSNRTYAYFKSNDYDTYWRNEYRISNTFYYEPKRDMELGLKLERRDSDIDDPDYGGYYTIAPVFKLDVGEISWRTEISLRKYDDESSWSTVARINAMVGF